MTTTRAMLTVADAASHCGVTTKTIQRRLPQLAELGAGKDEAGKWSIPYEALLGVGLKPGKPAGPDRADSPKDTPNVSEQKVQDDVRAENARLQREVQLLLQVVAAKDQALAAKDETLAWMRRQLPPGDTDKPAPAVDTEPAAEITSADLEAEPAAAEVEAANNVVTITEPAAAMPAPSTLAEKFDDIEPTKSAWRRRFATFFGKNS